MTTFRRSAVALGVTALLAVGTIVPAAAAPGGGAASDGGPGGSPNLEVLSEQYNLARIRAERADRAVAATNHEIDAARERAAALRTLTEARAAQLYRSAAGATPIAWLDSGSIEDVVRRARYTDAADAPDLDLLATLSRSLDRLEQRLTEQESARDRAREEARQAESARRRLLAEAAAAEARGATAAGDGAGPVGAPSATASTPTRAVSAVAPTRSATPSGPAPASTPPATRAPTPSPSSPPPASSRAAVAVAFARAQLGKPYVFAAAGPDAYDCSGLTMAAWRAAGVRMAHYSGSQANAFPRVAWSQLQPGDIVVFYSDYHHVGLYIGGGQMIHAPQTGDVVKVSPAWRTTFQFGVRPG